MSAVITNPIAMWLDKDGQALQQGQIYIGQPNTDPTRNPISVYQDEDLSIPMTQPIFTTDGLATVSGSPRQIFLGLTDQTYSIAVFNQCGELIISIPECSPSATLSPAGNAIVNEFVSGADFVGGTANSITLSGFPGSGQNLSPIYFDGVPQFYPEDFTLSGRTVTFTSPIPAFVNMVRAAWRTTVSIGTPADGTVSDAAVAANAAIDSAKLSFLQSGGSATRRSMQDKLREIVSVKDFGAKGDGVTDDTTAIQAAASYALALSSPCKIVFPPGIYCYSNSPNWAVQGMTVAAQGSVVLRYKGSGNAVILDAGAGAGTFVEFCTFGEQSNPFIIEAPKSSGHAIFARGLNTGCVLSAVVRGAGLTSAGLLTNACVITTFNVQVAPYSSGWYDDGTGPAKPQYGMVLNKRNAGEQTSYCTFINPQGAACQYGIYLDSTLGNILFGGDCEFNTTIGMVLTTSAFNNKIVGMDFEENGTPAGGGVDVSCAGQYNEFLCDTQSGGLTGGFRFVGGSVGNRLKGGVHDQVAIDGGIGNYVGEIVYQRSLSGNLQIIDNGTQTAFGRNWAAQQQKWTYGPSVVNAVVVGASPFTYMNTTGMPQHVYITGGTVQAAIAFRGATQLGVHSSGSLLDAGDSLSLTYSVLPTVVTATLQ